MKERICTHIYIDLQKNVWKAHKSEQRITSNDVINKKCKLKLIFKSTISSTDNDAADDVTAHQTTHAQHEESEAYKFIWKYFAYSKQ